MGQYAHVLCMHQSLHISHNINNNNNYNTVVHYHTPLLLANSYVYIIMLVKKKDKTQRKFPRCQKMIPFSILLDYQRLLLTVFAFVTLLLTRRLIINSSNDGLQMSIQKTSSELNCLLTNVCNSNYVQKFKVGMAAIPHTASSTTDRVFLARKQAWNTSLPLSNRGFVCLNKEQRVVRTDSKIFSSCMNSSDGEIYDTSNNNAYDCVIEKLTYNYKQHSNFNAMANMGYNVVFTTFRKPEQMILSQFRERESWDWTYKHLYPNDDMNTISIDEFIRKAWYRHNTFVKTLATNTKLIYRESNTSLIGPSKEASDYENSLGAHSKWLAIAMERLKLLPFFGLFHRLTESFELFGFHLCIPVDQFHHDLHAERPVSRNLDVIMKKYFVLDNMLLETAEELFDILYKRMKDKKEKGILCDMSSMVTGGSVYDTDATVGLRCI